MSSPPAGSLIANFGDSAETRISEAIGLAMMKLSPFWSGTVLNNTELESMTAGVASKNWYINKLYRLGQTGAGQMDPNDTFLFGEQETQFGHFGRRSTYSNITVDPGIVPKSRHILFTIPMKSQRWMLTKTVGESLYGTNPANQGDLEAGLIMDFGETVARSQCHFWYANQNEKYEYCKIANLAWVNRNGGTANTLQFTTDNEAIERFNENMLVDIRDASTATLIHNATGSYVGYVTNVDPSANAVEIQFVNASGTVGTSAAAGLTDIANGDSVVPYRDAASGSSAFKGFAGINSYLKASGALLGTDAIGTDGSGKIDVDEFPQFRSVVNTAVAGSLTPELLTRYVSLTMRQSRRLPGGEGIDTLYTTEGVLRQAINEMQAYHMLTGSGVMPSGVIQTSGDGGYSFNIAGRNFSIVADPWVESGTLYGTQLGNGNWRRAVPDDITGFASAPSIPTALPFRFIAGWYGFDNNQFPIYRTDSTYNQITEGVQMPGVIRYQVYPNNPVGLKLGGLTEDNVFQTPNS
jgi:hypothetical protein